MIGVYHNRDLDGFTSGAIIKLKYPDAKMIGYDYGHPFEQQVTGEGIVIKNYNYKNRFGRVVWAKIVKNEFKAKHAKCDVTEIKENKIIEEEIVNKFVTKALIEKELAKIETESGWSSKQIPRLLNTVYYCLVKEESWNFVKEFKNPIIDFKRLSFLRLTVSKK